MMQSDSMCYVISCFGSENIDWIKTLTIKYHLYVKSNIDTSIFAVENYTVISNVGYNIYSYMKFIVDNYDNLPDKVVFIKNNVFSRHVAKETFDKQVSRNVFTCIEERQRWTLIYPVSIRSSDNGFMELNTSWYTAYHPTKYFSNFNDFYKFIFDDKSVPRYLRFAPGGNYVVPKEHILLRSKEFYQNLITFVSHHQFSGESHMVERALYIIWNSTIEESEKMSKKLSNTDLKALMKSKKKVSLAFKVRIKIFIKLSQIVDSLAGKVFN